MNIFGFFKTRRLLRREISYVVNLLIPSSVMSQGRRNIGTEGVQVLNMKMVFNISTLGVGSGNEH